VFQKLIIALHFPVLLTSAYDRNQSINELYWQ